MVIQELFALLGFKVEGEDKLKQFDDGIKKASGTLSTFQAGLAGFAGGLAAGFATQIAKMAGSLATALNPLSAAGEIAPILDQLGKFADRTGIAFEALQELQYAAGQSGASVGEFQSSVQNISKNLAEAARGTGRAKTALEAYGLSAKDVGGNVKSADDFLGELANKFQTLDEGQQLDLASKLGISPAMITMLKSGNAEIEKLRKEAQESGLAFTEEDRQNSMLYVDTLSRFTQSIRALRHAIGVEALPMMTQFIAGMQTWFNTNREFLRQNISDVFRRIGFSLRTLRDILSGINVDHLKAIGIAFGIWAARAFPLIRNLAFIGFAIEDLLHYIGDGDSLFGSFVQWLQDTLGVSEGVAEAMAGVAAALLAITVLKPSALIRLVGALWGLAGATAALKALGASMAFTSMAAGLSTMGAAALAMAWKVAAGVAALWGLHTLAKKMAEGPFNPDTPMSEIMQTDKAREWAERLRGAVGLGSDAGAPVGARVGENLGAMLGGAVAPTQNNNIENNVTVQVPAGSDGASIGEAIGRALGDMQIKSLSVTGGTVATP
jgi:transcriptional regulator with XRE-family HTH domain